VLAVAAKIVLVGLLVMAVVWPDLGVAGLAVWCTGSRQASGSTLKHPAPWMT
jgi:hypothetical protein